MRIDDSPQTEPRKDDSSKFEDAREPPEIVRESSWRDRFRCFRRNPRERGARSTERGRSRERSVRSSASQTPEPERRTVGTSNRPTVRNAQTDSRLTRQRSARQRGVSSTNIERAPRRDAQTAPMRESWSPMNLSRQRGISGIDIPRTRNLSRQRGVSQLEFPRAPGRDAGVGANTLPRPHFPMGGGIGTADEPPMAPSAPEFGQLHQGGSPFRRRG